MYGHRTFQWFPSPLTGLLFRGGFTRSTCLRSLLPGCAVTTNVNPSIGRRNGAARGQPVSTAFLTLTHPGAIYSRVQIFGYAELSRVPLSPSNLVVA